MNRTWVRVRSPGSTSNRGLGVEHLGFGIWGLGFRVPGWGWRGLGVWFWVLASRFRVWELGVGFRD